MPNQSHRSIRVGCTAIFMAAGIFSGPAFAIDMNPHDWIPAPAGSDVLIVYGPWSHNNKAIVNGAEMDASLNSALVMPRMTHYFEINGQPAVVSALVPIGRLWNGSIGGADLGSRTGVGDLTMAFGYWAISDTKANRQLAVAGYLHVPIGGYDRDKALNIGRKSLSATLQVGNMIPLSENFKLETTADATFYRKESNANALGQTKKTENSYSFQNWLTYTVSPTTYFSVGHAINFGGTQEMDGIANGFNSKKQQAKVGLHHWLSPTLSIYGQINQDFEVKGGFKGTSGMLRLVKIL